MSLQDNFPTPHIWIGHRIAYGETDAMGIVYYAEYLQIFERARDAYIRESGFSYNEVEARGIYLPVREDSVSAGEIAPVEGTPFDLAAGVALGSGLDADDVQIARGHGYDHCLCIFGFEPGAAPRPALDAVDPASGRTLSICITHPGAHLYTGNWLGDGPALTKDGATYGPQAGFAFEPEYYPDGVHHPAWPQPVCTPDHPYEESIVYRFGIA